MSKDKHIDNISEKVWNAYFSGVILTSDKERVEAFLKQYPEFEEDFKGVTSSNAIAVGRITKNINARISSKYAKMKPPILWFGAVASVAIIVLFVFNNLDKPVQNISENDVNKEHIGSQDSVKQNVIEADQLDMEETIDDTMFFFERKGSEIKVDELIVEVKEIESFQEVNPVIVSDTNLVVEEKHKEVEAPKEVYKKSFKSSVDYRQTVHVEDNFYSQAKTMGKTTSYASPIKGYSYEIEGMPNFNGGDAELLSYIDNELSSDELINGKRRKMKASLSFVVTNKGKIKDVLVQNCNHKQFGMSLMQIMENMPDWNPSDFKGKKGKAHYVLKIVFE